ncbi:MAG: hypothetical protein AAF557_10700 [Pseudomonadota bacterium]
MTSPDRRHMLLGGLTLLALQPAAATAQSSSDRNLTGSYRSNGRNSNGAPYQGSAAIIEKDQEISITWTVDGQVYSGKGARQGLVVVVDWGSEFPIVYVVMPDGNLHGTWEDGRALEKLTRL